MRATRHLATDPDSPDPGVVAEAAAILRAGGLVAFPTETVYGLGAIATDDEAVAGIFLAKGRPPTNPLIVHAADLDMAKACAADWPPSASRLADAFWPGPLTIVLAKGPSIVVGVTAGGRSVAVRIPGPALARRLIEATGLPLAAPSANTSNGISPTTAAHVRGDLDGRIDAILDGGPSSVGIESTVVDLTDDRPTILRPGSITAQMLTDTLGGAMVEERPDPGADRRSPGRSPVHYSPGTPTYRVERAEELARLRLPDGSAVLRFGGPADGPGEWLGNPESTARRLYATLRRLDASHPRLILVLMPPDEPAWRGVRDRLLRASRPIREASLP